MDSLELAFVIQELFVLFVVLENEGTFIDHGDNHDHDGNDGQCGVVGLDEEGTFLEESAVQDVVHEPYADEQHKPPNAHVEG